MECCAWQREAETQRLVCKPGHGGPRSMPLLSRAVSQGAGGHYQPASSQLLPTWLVLPLSPQVQSAPRSCHCCCFLSRLPCCREESMGQHCCPQAANMMVMPGYWQGGQCQGQGDVQQPGTRVGTAPECHHPHSEQQDI